MFCDVYVSKLLRYETLLYVYLMLSDATLSDVKHASQQHHLNTCMWNWRNGYFTYILPVLHTIPHIHSHTPTPTSPPTREY